MFKVIHQKTVNEQLLLSTNFTANCELVFILTQKKRLFVEIHFKAKRKNVGSSEKQY